MGGLESSSGKEQKEGVVDVLNIERQRLSDLLGKPVAEPQEPLNEQDLLLRMRRVQSDHRYESLEEQAAMNRLQAQLDALQQRKVAKPDISELAVSQQTVTYFEYLPSVVHQVQNVLSRYAELRGRIPQVSDALQQQEQQSITYLRTLNGTIEERIAYANVRYLDQKFQKHQEGNRIPADLLAMREAAMRSLSPESQRAVMQSPDRQRIRGNQLDQRIFDILSGNANLEGVQPNFLPQRMYTALLSERIQQLAEQERVRARAGKWQEDSPEAQERKRLTEEMVTVTDELGRYQLNMAELATVQHQFGDDWDPTGASQPKRERSSPDTRGAMEKSMELRSEFHLNQMNQFMRTVQDEVLHVGLPEHIEEFSNETGRSLVLGLSQRIANLFSAVVPETAGLRNTFRDYLVGPLEQAMGWPPGVKWEDLTPEQKENIQKKTQSVLDAIRSFDRKKIVAFQQTVNLIRMMPPASTFAGQAVREPLPDERIEAATSAELQPYIERLGGPTVYALLFRQLDEQWGDQEQGTGFIGEYRRFYGKITEIVDVHGDVSNALHQLGQRYDDFWKYLAMAAGAFILLREVLPRAARSFSAVHRARKTAALNRRVKDAEATATRERTARLAAEREAEAARRDAQAAREELKKRAPKPPDGPDAPGPGTPPDEPPGPPPEGPAGGKPPKGPTPQETPTTPGAAQREITERLGKYGRGAKVIGAVATGLNLLALAEAHAKEQDNRQKAEVTTDTDLRAFYESSNALLRSGTIVQGMEVVSLAGSTVALPLALASQAARYTHDELERSVEFWLQGPDELAGLTPAELLHRIQTAGQSAVTRQLVERADEADAQARSELWREYFRKTTTMAPRTIEKRGGGRAPATDTQNGNFAAELINRKLIYIKKVTNGTFQKVDAQTLHEADHFAAVMTNAAEAKNRHLTSLYDRSPEEIRAFVQERQAETDAHALELLSLDVSLHGTSSAEAVNRAFAHERRQLEGTAIGMTQRQREQVLGKFDRLVAATAATVDAAKETLLDGTEDQKDAKLRRTFQQQVKELQDFAKSDKHTLLLRLLGR